MSLIARLRRFAGKHVPVAARAHVRAIRRSRATERRRVAELSAERDRLKSALARRQDTGDFARRLAAGQSFDQAAVAVVRDMIKAGDLDEAMAFAYALTDEPGRAPAGHLASAVIATVRKLPDLAYGHFQYVEPDAWLQYAAAEYLDAVYRCTPAKLAGVLHDVLESPYSHQNAATLFEVIRYAYVLRDLDIAKSAYRRLGTVTSPGQNIDVETEVEWLRPWLDVPNDDESRPASGDVRFALLDYRQPGRAKTSQNIGDHIQTLSSLGHVVRHQNVRFCGDGELIEFVGKMQQGVRQDRRLDTAVRDVALTVVNRDASTYQAVPKDTWALVYGWFMHPVFGLRHDFPMHPNLRPIFVSFHCNKREILTPEAVDYLRRYGPVGCRDWTTVDLLLSLDVPAYFSGCLTTTIDTFFPEVDQSTRRREPATVYVDMRRDLVPTGAATAKHSYRQVKQRSFVENLTDGIELLERYRREFTDVVTSRLHCYLPARSLGLHVDFQPKNRADIRFAGLIDIDEAAFNSIRTSMLARVETVTRAILDGHSVDEVYARWRDACADDVAEARARHALLTPLPRANVGIYAGEQATRVQHDSDQSSPIELAIVAGDNDEPQLEVTLGSVIEHASSHVRVWLVGRGWTRSQVDGFNEMDNALDVQLVASDELPAGTESLLLPSLLPDPGRVIVVPAGSVLLADLAELGSLDLDGYPLAAATSSGTSARSGFGVIYRAAKRLHPDASTAQELYLRAHARHRFDFDAFDTDVLVLDLERLRKDDFVAAFMPYHERFGLRAREIFNLYAGPDRAILPNEWAHLPTKQWCASPKLVHWNGTSKPWEDLYVPARRLWHQAQSS